MSDAMGEPSGRAVMRAATGDAAESLGSAAPVIQAIGLVKGYPSGEDHLEVLTATELEVRAGERVAVLGASGIGKSTLLHLLGGLDRPDAGTISFRGRDLAAMSEPELAAYRNHEVGFVFQFFQLLPEFSALENVMMPLLVGRERRGVRERAAEVLQQVGLESRSHHYPSQLSGGELQQVGLESRSHHYPSQLSGGERQRVAIARSLVREPSLVLADEPTGNLDVDTGLRVMDVFARLQQERGAAIVMATHNAALIAGFDRVLQMQPGGRLEPTPSADVPSGSV